jgi:GTPase SAR1 family protein
MAQNKSHGTNDKTSLKVQEQHQTKSDLTNEKRDSNKENVKPERQNNSATITPAISLPELVKAEASEKEYFIRCVMLGAENTGKHTLINASFPGSVKPYPRTSVDLFTKEKVQFKTTKKYHFWTRTLGETSETTEAIWKTYYKWANAFVFVYDTTNKESFEALENAVESVMRVVPREKFFGILVGTKSDLSQEKAVDSKLALDFKQKYNLNHFVETNSSIEKETAQMLQKLDAKLKLTFEAI